VSASSAWSDLGDGIRVRQSRVYWMNSVVLSHPEHTVIVDPGVLPSELDDLVRAAPARDSATTTLAFTHGDWDHVLGRPWWPRAETLAHDRFAADVRAHRDRILEEARKAATDAGETWERGFTPFVPDQAVSGLRFTRLGPWRLVLRDAYGHSPSMLTLHLPERRLLLAADLLSDIEIPMIEQSPEAYRATLEELAPLARNGAIETLVPGHGSIAHGAAAVIERIERDLDYLERLDAAVSRARGRPLEAVQSELAGMDYLGKHAAYAMNDVHAKNVAIAWRSANGRAGS
jgi:glyoxylase-like metal-dependent hydrolase (beta-lactamase superfamily II)